METMEDRVIRWIELYAIRLYPVLLITWAVLVC